MKTTQFWEQGMFWSISITDQFSYKWYTYDLELQ